MTSTLEHLFLPILVSVMMVSGCSSSTSTTRPGSGASVKDEPGSPHESEATITITITDPSQREAAVDKAVVVIGIQTRTKQPQVNGVDVDGAYDLSDKKVVARGVLRKTVVSEGPPSKDGLHVASRGAGTFYAVIDPSTKQTAKTTLAE